MPKIITQQQFIEKCKTVHGDTYDLSQVRYVNMRQSIEVRCKVHGSFYPTPVNFVHGGTGCPKCAGRDADWVERFRSVHGDEYDYSQFDYKDYKEPATVICKTHGAFMQTPDNHYRGKQGCPACKGKKIQQSKQMPFLEFVRRANLKHKNQFTYSYQEWTNALTGVVQVHCCHGTHEQNPVNHLAGKIPCPKCGDKKSKGELEVADFVKIFTTVKQRDRRQIAPRELDLYIPSKAIALEYHGMYYHAHWTAADEKANKYKTFDKYKACAERGIRLITVYESEWETRKTQIKRLLRNAVGAFRGKVMARKCQLVQVSNAEARVFFEKYHVQGGAGNGEHYGLTWKGKLVACMRFNLGSLDRGSAAATRTWTLARYATRLPVTGGASRLFQAFVKDKDPQEVKSFSDNRYFAGDMYQAIGFTLEDESKPDYQVWHQKTGLRPKTHYQRRQLQSRMVELGIQGEYNAATDPRTEQAMTYFMGCGRMYDCGKKRWTWIKPRGKHEQSHPGTDRRRDCVHPLSEPHSSGATQRGQGHADHNHLPDDYEKRVCGRRPFSLRGSQQLQP